MERLAKLLARQALLGAAGLAVAACASTPCLDSVTTYAEAGGYRGKSSEPYYGERVDGKNRGVDVRAGVSLTWDPLCGRRGEVEE